MKFIGIDLFAGAGGVTTGIELAKINGKKIAFVKACINHDPVAIESHACNHKKTIHFTEDIKDFDVKRFPKLKIKKDDITYIWASLECTNFSNAKGGLPRDADSRTLANHLFRYIDHINPDYIFIENVREFMSWGDLDCNCKPVSKDKGRLYIKWVNKVKSFGYDYDARILNSADFGAYTSRKRLFIIFAKIGLPIIFPEPTHSRKVNMFGLKKWNAVKEVLDLEDKGQSILSRKKDLSEKTYKRIYAGLIKYVANGDESFFTKWLGNNQQTGINQGKSINEPAPVVTTQNRLGLVSAEFLLNYNHSSNVNGINNPCPALTTKDRIAIVNPSFLTKYHGSGENILSTNDVCSTLSTKDRLALIQPQYFLDLQFSQGKQNASIEDPNGSLLTVPKENLVTVEKCFIDEQYGQSRCASIENPLGTLTANPKQNLVTAESVWLLDTNYNNIGTSIDEPAPVITASRHQHYLMNPQFNNKGGSIENPCFTLIAKMDKRPPYLISTEDGQAAIQVFKTDLEIIVKIKQFMAAYGIIDIKMRMLKVKELLKIQGFDEDYILKGNQAQQKKFIGNAVVPVIPKKMIETLYSVNLENKQLIKNKVA